MIRAGARWDAVLGEVPRGEGGHVYVAEFETGVVKVGFSGNPRTRIAILYSDMKRKFNTHINRLYVSGAMPKKTALATEVELKNRMRIIASRFVGTEFFINTEFSLVENLARQLAVRNGADKNGCVRLVALRRQKNAAILKKQRNLS